MLVDVDFVIEFEDESSGYSYVYSESIFLRFGFAATVMNTKIQATLKNKISRYTWVFISAISLPINFANSKYYLFKK